MITKTLKTSGGDFATFAEFKTYVVDILNNGVGLVDDITLNIEGGFSCNNTGGTDYLLFGAASAKWNDKTVLVQTDPAQIYNPAIVYGSFATSAGGGTNGDLTFKNIKMASVNAAAGVMFYEQYARINLLNCLIYWDYAAVIFGDAGGGSVHGYSENCSFFIAHVSIFIAGTLRTGTKNNIVVGFTNSDPGDYPATSFGTYAIVYNFGSGEFIITDQPASVLIQDPKHIDQVMQAETDTIAIMLARSAKLQAISPAIDHGDAVLSTDIIGVTRTADDVGAYTYTSTVTPDTYYPMQEGDPVRDTTKFDGTLNNFEPLAIAKSGDLIIDKAVNSKLIIEGKDYTFQKTIRIKGIPIDRTGKTCTISIFRFVDSLYWNASLNAWVEGIVENSTDATLGYGMFAYTATASSDFFDTSLDNGYDILVTFTVTDDGTSATLYQDSEIMTIAKGTPLYNQEIANALSTIPEGDGFHPSSVNGMIQLVNQVSKHAIQYDFTTYTKAVMFYYDEDYDAGFSGDPILWRYVYNASHGKPTASSEIVYGDRVRDYSLVQPV